MEWESKYIHSNRYGRNRLLRGLGRQPCTHMVFMYHQESLEECEEVDGVYYATYDSWVVDAERNVTYIESDGTKVSLTIPVGEYGVKP